MKRLFAVTFSNSLSAGPRQRWLPVPRHRFPAEKEPTNVAFHRHLLGCGCADGFGGSLLAAVLLYLLYFRMVDQIRMAVGMGEEVGLEG